MPIEIKELHIKVTVNSPQEEQASAVQNTGSAGQGKGGGDGDKDAVVAECVEQVLQILQYKTER